MDPQHLTTASYATSAAGIFLLGLNLVFPVLFPDGGAWSDANAEEHRVAAAELYRLSHVHAGHSHDHADADEPDDLAAARERFEASKNNLEGSVGGRHTLRSVIKWLGIVLAAVGIGGAMMLRFGVGEG